MKLGIGSYTYTWAIGVPSYLGAQSKLTVLELLRRAKQYNLQVVQFCDNLPLHSLSSKELLELKNEAEDAGISIEVGTRGIEPQHLRKYLEIARYLDSDLLRVILHKEGGRLGIDEAYTELREIVPELETMNIRLAIENHERHSVKELAYLVNKLGSRYVGVCLDTVNSFGALETPEQVITELAPYVINLHYKDFIIKRIDSMMGFEIVGSPAGQGMLNCTKLMQQLKDDGKDYSVILELWTPFTETVEKTILLESRWAEESIQYLKNWIR